ncbi:hypothetical protein [Neisseria dentiae]|uniref:hypothetical protein n=1 Tax=Neisseria dentiae TaxID=194197 RepID=UPI00117C6F2E|nr:hypothetical protein [Neisseria dentiae]QMT44494.1 hypothetical protein H3L92_08440 [Neisseria dentiae]
MYNTLPRFGRALKYAVNQTGETKIPVVSVFCASSYSAIHSRKIFFENFMFQKARPNSIETPKGRFGRLKTVNNSL